MCPVSQQSDCVFYVFENVFYRIQFLPENASLRHNHLYISFIASNQYCVMKMDLFAMNLMDFRFNEIVFSCQSILGI